MIESIYSEVGHLKTAEEIESRLTDIGFWEMFDALKTAFPDRWEIVVKWVMHTYSLTSNYIAIGSNWEETKRKIADIVRLPKDDVYEKIILLQNPVVFEVVRSYLDWQGSREFKHLLMLRETYDRMLNSTFLLATVKEGAENDVNYDQIFKNTEYARKLYEQIGEYEERIKQLWPRELYDAKAEIDKGRKSKSVTLESRIGTQRQ